MRRVMRRQPTRKAADAARLTAFLPDARLAEG
jgi:hypothetical protein